ncbi:SIS domain-containing protein [Brassicibacter mesophilus]|uniref:SIS domain-containing protein n=1 Tax=Brassicibacter mesophilus TaxID=745119 RepID=UPI003D20C6C7
MLDLDKSTVEFLVTSSMVEEVENVLTNCTRKVQNVVDTMIHNNIKKLFFVGCGSSKAVGDAGKYITEKYSTLCSSSYTGWEFVDNTPKAVDENSMVILTSQSGKTEEVVEALRKANSLGAVTVGICNKAEGNPLGEESKITVDYNAEAMWECQLVIVYSIIGRYIQKIEPSKEIDKLLEDIINLPKVLKYHVENFEDKAFEIAKKISEWKGFYTVAAGPLTSLAYKEGVITNMEFMWGHGAVIHSGEFRHGPLEIVEEKVPFVFLLGTDASRHITERALNFVKKYKGDYIVFDYKDFNMGLHEDLSPLVMFVPLEWFSYYFALVRDHNPDDRRYYGIVEY